MFGGGGTVVVGRVVTDGRVVVEDGTTIEVVGGGSVVVVGSGAVVGVVVVWAGGAVVPLDDGAVVTIGARVVAVVPLGPEATVVVESTVEEVDVDVELEVGRATVVVVAGRVVVVGDWVATCCLGELSVPVASSTSSAAKATAAMA